MRTQASPAAPHARAPPVHAKPKPCDVLSSRMFSANNKQQTQSLWMWRMEYLHHEQRPLYFGEWF